MRPRIRLQEIIDHGKVELTFDGVLIWRGGPLSPMDAVKAIRAVFPILDIRSARALLNNRETLNLEYD